MRGPDRIERRGARGHNGTVRRFLVALIVVAALVVAADFAGRFYAQQRTAGTVSDHLPQHADTEVRIHGWSFLVQAARGTYSHVTIDNSDLDIGPLSEVDTTVDLHDAELSLSDAMAGDLTDFTAGDATLTARIPAEAMVAALDRPGLTFSHQSGNTAQVRTTVAVHGRTYPVTLAVHLSIADDALQLSATPVATAGIDLPQQVLDQVAGQVSTSISLKAVPFPLESATVAMSGDEVVVTASATDISGAQLHLTKS